MSSWWVVAAMAGPPCTSAGFGIVINELIADPPSTDAGLEWVEIKNSTDQIIDVSGWQIASGTSSYVLSDPLPSGTSIAAGDYLVVGTDTIPEADVIAAGFSLGNASGNADAVQLLDCIGAVSDTIVYGTPNEDGWLDDQGALASSLAPTPSEGVTLGRLPDGMDSDQSGNDVIALPYPTPGEANDAPPTTCGGPSSGVKINEILSDPDGTDDGLEWVELFHAGDAPVDLAGWSLRMGTSSLSVVYTWDQGVMSPGDRLLIGGELVTGADIVVDTLSLGNATSSTDAVAVTDCLGFPADTLLYGSPNTDAFIDDSGEIASSTAVAPGTDASLQRLSDGVDTDDCGNDFVVNPDPTPGVENEEIAPVVCLPSEGSVVINELMPDPDGTDDGLEWIELYNNSDEVVSIAGWALSLGTQDFEGRDVIFAANVAISAHSFLLVGGEDAEDVDIEAEFSLGNGTETDGIRLLDCEDNVVDTVLYGEAPNLDGLPDDNDDVVDPYGDPGSEDSLAREEDGRDSDAASDWKVTGIPTPGASNVLDLSGISSEIDRVGCRCGDRQPPDGQPSHRSSDPAGGCSQSALPRQTALLAALLGAIARRRRR